MHKLILASQSPRRIEALHLLKIQFLPIPNTIDESAEIERFDKNPEETALHLSKRKAESISKKYPDCYILGMDTIVVFQNEIIGKPKNEKNAIEMLMRLNGKWHSVITGITLLQKNSNYSDSKTIKTDVKFLELTKDFIENYVSLGESLDKAGGYGIQSEGKHLVEKINGDYSNIVGFPEDSVISMLKHAGLYNQITCDRKQKADKGQSSDF